MEHGQASTTPSTSPATTAVSIELMASTTGDTTLLGWSKFVIQSGGRHDNSLSFFHWLNQIRCTPEPVRGTKNQPHSSNFGAHWH
eukprot:8434483-Ditylum_brightwellii.AAC.2